MRVLPHRVTVALVVATLLLPVASAQEDPGSEALYLTPTGGSRDHGNLTTFPSNETIPVDMAPSNTQPTESRIEWWWGLDWLPHNATIPRGTTIEVVVYMGAFGLTVPTMDPTTLPGTPGGYRITAEVQSGGSAFGSGATVLDVTPLSDGTVVHEIRIAFATATEATLPAQRAGASGAPAAPVFRLIVGVDGIAPEGGTTPALYVDSVDTPSRILVPGFPYAAYRAVELDALTQAECHERVLQQLECDDPTPTRTDAAPQPFLGGGPGIGFLIAMAALSAGAVWAARRIVP